MIKKRLIQALSFALLTVMVLALMANSSCEQAADSLMSNSWGTSHPTSSMQQTPEDYVDEYDALNDAFAEMDDLLNNLKLAIEAATEATEDCGDITTSIANALEEDDTDAVELLFSDGEEVLEFANSVHTSLLDAIDAVETQLTEIEAIIKILDDAGQDTDAYDTKTIADTLGAGTTASTNLSTAMEDLDDILAKAREHLLGFTLVISPNPGGSGAFGHDILFIAWGDDARYVRHTHEIDVRELYVTVAGDNLSYQWYANTVNFNIGGRPISGATSRTYKPSTQDQGITYYYCVVSTPSGSSVPSPTLSVEVFSSQADLNASITAQTYSRLYMQGDTVNESNSLFIEATSSSDNVYYQWYTANSEGVAQTLILGATQSHFFPPTDQVGEFYYLCVASFDTGYPNLVSHTAQVQVFPYLVITSQPQGAQYTQGATAAPLTMAAEGENLSYQWYTYGDVPGVAKTPIEGATAASYTPPTDTLGTVSYSCEVSNIVNNIRNVRVTQVVDVEVIAATQPLTLSTSDADTYTYDWHVTPAALTVTAAGGTGSYSYQWYEDNALIPGANSPSYTPTALAGAPDVPIINEYHCVVTDANGATANSKTIIFRRI